MMEGYVRDVSTTRRRKKTCTGLKRKWWMTKNERDRNRERRKAWKCIVASENSGW
jgi:hypothetical protein